MVAKLPPYRFTIDQYRRMIAGGILTERDRVELIRGEVVAKMPIGPRHAAVVKRLSRLLAPQLAGRAIAGAQDPVALSDSEPEPDFTLLRPRADDYASNHPGPGDVLLVVEVADSSLTADLGDGATLYAENGIPEYWVVDLIHDLIHVHRGPQPDGTWATVTDHGRGDTLTVTALPGVSVTVAELLP